MATYITSIGSGGRYASITEWSAAATAFVNAGNVEVGVIMESGLTIPSGNTEYIAGATSTASAYKHLRSGLYDTIWQWPTSSSSSYSITVTHAGGSASGTVSGASAATIASGLAAIGSVGSGNVVVKTLGSNYEIHFTSALTGVDVTMSGLASLAKAAPGGGVAASFRGKTGAYITKYLSGTTFGRTALLIGERYVRLTGVYLWGAIDRAYGEPDVPIKGFEITAAGDGCIMDGCAVVIQRGTITSGSYGFDILADEGVLPGGLCADLRNCIAVGGGGFHGIGAGFHASTSAPFRLANCLAYSCANATTGAYDLTGATSAAIDVRNCMAFRCLLPDNSFKFTNPSSLTSVDRLMCDGAVPAVTGATVYPDLEADLVFGGHDSFFFPLSATSPAINKGVNLSTVFNTDFSGASRGTSLSLWDIGPFEGYAFKSTAAPTEEVTTVSTTAELAAWELATRKSPANSRTIYVAEVAATNVALPDWVGGAVCDEDCYRTIRPDRATNYYNPVTGGGYALRYPANGTWIDERYFRLEGFRIVNSGAPTADGMRLIAKGATIDRCVVESSTAPAVSTLSLVYIESDKAKITNSGVRATSAGTAFRYGVRVNPAGGIVGNCAVHRATSVGVYSPALASGVVKVVNTVAWACTDGAFNVTPGSIYHCMDDDGSATGTAPFNFADPSTVFQGAGRGDYRLKVNSPALNVGLAVPDLYDTDFYGNQRAYPWDLGPVDGVPFVGYTAKVSLGTSMRLCTCYIIDRTDGASLYLTDSNAPLYFRGLLFVPAASGRSSARRSSTTAGESTFDLAGGINRLSSSRITLDDLRAGRYDSAVVTEYVLDWSSPFAEPVRVHQWLVQRVDYSDNSWVAYMDGIATRLLSPAGRVMNRQCNADLGDGRCRVKLETLTSFAWEGVAVASLGADVRRDFVGTNLPDNPTTRPNGYYQLGRVVWRSGSNVGLVSDVKADAITGTSQRTLKIQLRTPFDIEVGDTFDLVPGCDKRAATCEVKYANLANFRGFPFMETTDKLFNTPT